MCLTDDNDEPDPQYEAFMDALIGDEEDESSEKARKRHRGRFTRGTKHRPRNSEESEEEDYYNPAEPSSTKAPDSNTRRQELLAKVAAAAGSKYSYHAIALHSNNNSGLKILHTVTALRNVWRFTSTTTVFH